VFLVRALIRVRMIPSKALSVQYWPLAILMCSMMMTMTVLNKHVDSADCCLIGIVLGVTKKNIPQ